MSLCTNCLSELVTPLGAHGSGAVSEVETASRMQLCKLCAACRPQQRQRRPAWSACHPGIAILWRAGFEVVSALPAISRSASPSPFGSAAHALPPVPHGNGGGGGAPAASAASASAAFPVDKGDAATSAHTEAAGAGGAPLPASAQRSLWELVSGWLIAFGPAMFVYASLCLA